MQIRSNIKAGEDILIHTVKEGETLTGLAYRYYKNAYLYNDICKANNLKNCDLIEVGQQLIIPLPQKS